MRGLRSLQRGAGCESSLTYETGRKGVRRSRRGRALLSVDELSCCFFFFFQAEDGIRDLIVTGVQTCALPISERLDYIKSLGVDAIWLTPIFKARSNHRYDTDNYLHVDPALGGDAAFASLVAAAKSHGIRLILDGVFNHASSDSLYFDRYHRYPSDGACESTSSPYRTWFQIQGSTPCTASDYVGWSGLDTLPVFRHDNAAVKDFFFGGGVPVIKHRPRLRGGRLRPGA